MSMIAMLAVIARRRDAAPPEGEDFKLEVYLNDELVRTKTSKARGVASVTQSESVMAAPVETVNRELPSMIASVSVGTEMEAV